MLDFINQYRLKQKLKKNYNLSIEELRFINLLLNIFSISPPQKILNHEFFQELIPQTSHNETLVQQFPSHNEIDFLVMGIYHKLFTHDTNPEKFQTTRQIPINSLVSLTFYQLNCFASGIIFDNVQNFLSVRLLDPAGCQDITPNQEVLLRFHHHTHGVYEALTTIVDFQPSPFQLLLLRHKEMLHQERRRYVRYNIDLNTMVFHLIPDQKEQETIPITIDNMSLGGIQIISEFYFEDNTVVSVMIPDAHIHEPLPLKIISRRFNAEAHKYSYHTMFQGITDIEALKIEQFIKYYRKKT